MKVELIRGNPIVIAIGSAVFSIIGIILAITTMIEEVDAHIAPLILLMFTTVYSQIGLVVFYIAYERSKWSFMSPKKYKKAIQLNEKYSKDIHSLKIILEKIDPKYRNINDDIAIEKAIELLEIGHRDKSSN